MTGGAKALCRGLGSLGCQTPILLVAICCWPMNFRAAEVVPDATPTASPQQQYLKRALAQDELLKKKSLQLQQAAREQAAVAEILQAAHAEHANVIAASQPPPPQPNFIERHRGPCLIGLAALLCGVFCVRTMRRLKIHREM